MVAMALEREGSFGTGVEQGFEVFGELGFDVFECARRDRVAYNGQHGPGVVDGGGQWHAFSQTETLEEFFEGEPSRQWGADHVVTDLCRKLRGEVSCCSFGEPFAESF